MDPTEAQLGFDWRYLKVIYLQFAMSLSLALFTRTMRAPCCQISINAAHSLALWKLFLVHKGKRTFVPTKDLPYFTY